MSSLTPPKGTRDFGPEEMSRRDYIFNTIRNVFIQYGYHHIETPAMENLSTLLGKYGDEGDKLLFRILNSGDFLKKIDKKVLAEGNYEDIISDIAEKGLRYDLTVPFARFVVQHRNEITFPFKRFQIQPVWRADRPQKGRYREFYQCDVDVIGSDSLLNEVEMIKMAEVIFKKLNINVNILINNRKILTGIAEVIGHADKIVPITVAIDKIDKIGIDNVKNELIEKGISENDFGKLKPFLELKGSNAEKIDVLSQYLAKSEIGMKGLEEIKTVFNYLNYISVDFPVILDVSLARGLNYYTGAILEIKAQDVSIGSISGGGRYDDLTGIFGLENTSGVGISFGADRIYDVMNELNLFEKIDTDKLQVLLINFGGEPEIKALKTLYYLRDNNISAQLYPDNAKIKKQFAYADSLNAKYALIIGQNEVDNEVYQVKNMITGEQKTVTHQELLDAVSA
ncbi:MAG: histidine--tRNA ligase [Bacteroidales bacterium]|jgi:histidyl-tRNA synthetase